MKKRASPTRDRLMALLSHYPEGLNVSEIVAEDGLTLENLRSVLLWDRRRHGSNNFRILRYDLMRGKGGKPRPIYVVGPGPDAERPKIDPVKSRKQIRARSLDKYRAIINAKARAKRAVNIAHPFAGLFR